jgi:hypothetical protein
VCVRELALRAVALGRVGEQEKSEATLREMLAVGAARPAKTGARIVSALIV